MFAFITAYVGQVYDAEEHDHLVCVCVCVWWRW